MVLPRPHVAVAAALGALARRQSPAGRAVRDHGLDVRVERVRAAPVRARGRGHVRGPGDLRLFLFEGWECCPLWGGERVLRGLLGEAGWWSWCGGFDREPELVGRTMCGGGRHGVERGGIGRRLTW